MTLTQIKKFENLNDISINVYCIEKKKELSIFSIRLTDQKMDKHVNLLYVQNDDDVGHFAWIKNLSRLVVHNSVNMDARNSFAIGTYTLNKNYKIFYNFSRE